MTSRGNSSISPPVQIPLQSQPRQVNGLPSGTPPPQQQFYPGQTQVYEYIPGPGSAPPQTGPLLSYQAYGSAPNDLRSGAAGVGRGGGPPQALAQGGTIFQQPGQTMRPQPPQQPGQATYFISQGVMRQPRPPQQPQTMLYMPPGNFTTPTGNVVLQQVGQYPTRNMGPYYSPNQGYYGNFPQQMYIHSNQMGAGRGMINPQNPNRPGSQPREKKLIEIKDPNSGRNVTDEILHSQRPHSVESEHTEEPSASRQANDIPSQFALKVAERLKTPGSPEVPVEASPATNGDISGAGPVSGGQYQQPPPMGGMMRPPMMPGQGPMHPSHMMGAHQGMMHPGASATPPEMHQRPPVDLSLPPPQLPPQVRQPTPAQIYSVGPQQGQHSQGPHHGQRHPQPQQVVRSAPMPPPAMVPQQQVQQQQELAQPQQPQQQPVAMPPQSQPVAEEPPAAPVEEKRPAAPKPAPVQQPPALENIPQPAAVVPVSVPTPAAAPAPVKEESPAPAEEVAPASPKEPTPARETTPPKTEEPAGANIQANKDGRKGKKAKKDFSRKDIGGSDMDAFIDKPGDEIQEKVPNGHSSEKSTTREVVPTVNGASFGDPSTQSVKISSADGTKSLSSRLGDKTPTVTSNPLQGFLQRKDSLVVGVRSEPSSPVVQAPLQSMWSKVVAGTSKPVSSPAPRSPSILPKTQDKPPDSRLPAKSEVSKVDQDVKVESAVQPEKPKSNGVDVVQSSEVKSNGVAEGFVTVEATEKSTHSKPRSESQKKEAVPQADSKYKQKKKKKKGRKTPPMKAKKGSEENSEEKSVESVDTKPPLPPSATERRTSLDNKGTPVEKPAFSYADAATSAVDSNKAKQPSPPQAATPAPVNQPKQADEEKLPEAEVSPAEPSPPTEAPKEAAAPVPAPQPTVQKVSPEPEAPAKASSATIPAEVPSARPSEEDEVPPVERKVDSEAAPVDPVPQVKVNDENAPPKEVKATTENAKDESPVGEEDGFKKPAEKPKPKGEDAKERLLYDRTYLISLRECPHSQTKPEGLPNLDIILDKPNISSSRSAMSTSLDFTPSFFQPAAGNQRAPQIGKSSSRGRQRPDMPQQRIIKSVSIQNDVKMLHQSEKPWKPKAAVAGDAEKAPSKSLESDVLFIMNRLTPTNFEKLAGEMRQLAIKTYEDLQQLVKIFFDKVTIETKFVQAYAQLCRVLSQIKVPPPPGMKENQATFRVVMLTKCQQEFEADKSIVFEDPEEKKKKLEAEIPDAPDKAEKIDTILYKMKLKRLKFYGNIRFIGELFKLNMLTENIMHDCIFRLLKARDDDSLVSLCNLISTVGQNLDTEKAKSRMDQYFTQMEKIAEERKSRIKFTLKDVIDLRKHNWVPRKETTGPKKIDEIHKDFQKEQIRQQFLSSQPPPPRNDNQQPGSRRGSRQREEQKPSDDGWNTVGSKSLRIDASKMKLSKNVVDEDNIQLGPGGGMNRFSMWGRGSSGNAQPSQDTERAPASNRFSALRNEEDRRNFQRSPSRGDSGPAGRGMRQGPTAGHGRGRNLARSSQEGERRDLLNSARSIVGGGGRSQNSSRDNSWNREDRRPAMGPRGSREGESQMTRSDIVRPSDDYRSPNVPPAAPAKKIREMSEEEMEAKARTILEEYLNIRDLTEAKLCVSELAGQPRLHLVVTASINDVLERNDKARELTGQYLHELVKNNVISLDAYFKGLSEVLQFAEDMVIDIPMMWSYLAQTIAPLLVGGSLPWAKLSTILKADLSENCAVLLLVQLVKVSTSLTSEAEVAQMWQNSGLSWADFVKPSDVEGFLKDKRLEYTINPVSASSLPPRPSVSANSEADLERLKRDIESMTFKGCPDHELKSHIEKLVPADRRDKTFVRTLTTAIVKSSIALPEPKVNEDVIRNRREVLGTFINKPEFELEALYAIQALMTELEHPKAVINTLFDSFYNEEIVSEEAFKLWETSNDPAEQLGKGVCKLQLKQFFTWLRENEEVEASS